MSIEKYVLKKESIGFTTIPNNVLQGLKDYEALGLYCYMVSLPHNWEFYKKQLSDHAKIGRDKLNKLLRSLKKCNLIDYVQSKNDKGRFEHLELHVKSGRDFIPLSDSKVTNDIPITHDTENPSTGTASPLTENPLTENQSLDNRTYKGNKDKGNKETKEREAQPVDKLLNRALDASVQDKQKPSLLSFQPLRASLEAALAKGVDVSALKAKFIRYYSQENEFGRNWPDLFHKWVERERIAQRKAALETVFADVSKQSTSFGAEPSETPEESQRKWEEQMRELGYDWKARKLSA